MEYSATATINATPEQIWEILTQTAAYPEWDPSCEKIVGELTLGGKLKAYSKLSPGRAFKVKVTELSPSERMTWSGGMPFGLFKGVRTFTISTNGDDGTRFTLREKFSGPMLKLIGGSIPDMTGAFEGFVQGLKTRAEAA